jgi:AI-2 transport protein TqsA
MMLTKRKLAQYVPINNACLVILTGVALTAFLSYTKAVVMPLVIALFISILSNTIATWMNERWNIPRVVGLIITVLIFLGVATLCALFVSNSIESFIQGADIYTQKLNDSLEWILATAQRHGIKTNPEVMSNYISAIPVFNVMRSMGGGIVSFLSSLVLICLFVIFMFMGHASEKTDFASSIEKQISYYLIIKISVSFLAALCTWIVLAALKTELAVMLALITLVLNFIPNIGPVISTVMPMPVLFLQYGFDWRFILALVLLSAVHFIIGNILETKWLGKSMDLSPVVVIISLVFWAIVWGAMGALIAVPLTSILKIVLERSEPTKPLAEILEGKLPFK